jgi:exosortase/archaeosortase family protein
VDASFATLTTGTPLVDAQGYPLPSVLVGSAGGGTPVVTTPELRVLRQLGSHYGPRVAASVNPTLQRATAIGATGVLKALGISATRTGNRIALPSVTLDVIQWCSGLYTIKILVLFAGVVGGVAIFLRRSWVTGLALIVAAPIIGLEINALRVASVGFGFEVLGFSAASKDWAGWMTLTLGMAQILGLGWVMTRSRAGEGRRVMVDE